VSTWHGALLGTGATLPLPFTMTFLVSGVQPVLDWSEMYISSFSVLETGPVHWACG
jgi:hypothetical protein